jgi:SNF2 family DNA or RNA helicase
VVFDEIQELRRNESAKHEAAKKLADSVEYVLGLSATPIYNYGDEAWNIFNVIKDGCLDTRNNFLREWCGWNQRVQDPKALGAFLREQYLFLRRERQEVGRELPPVNKVVETVDHDQEALDKVESLAKVLAVKVVQGTFMERGQAARELDLMVRHATGLSKAKYVAQFVRMLVESGEPVLLAGWHRDVYDIWLNEFKGLNPVMYTGSESATQKNESKRKFMAGESNLMIISLRSGVGLDGLQDRASIVVIGELDWSPQIHEQIIGRLNRDRSDGQMNQVTSIFLNSNGGSDPGIVEVLGLKSSQAQGILDPFSSATVVNTDSTRIQDLAKRYLQNKEVQQQKETGDENALSLF